MRSDDVGDCGVQPDIELSIISIAVEGNSMPAYDVAQGKHINGEKGGAERPNPEALHV